MDQTELEQEQRVLVAKAKLNVLRAALAADDKSKVEACLRGADLTALAVVAAGEVEKAEAALTIYKRSMGALLDVPVTPAGSCFCTALRASWAAVNFAEGLR